MKDWIPFLIAVVWPVTLVIILVVFRKHIESIVRSFDNRIRKGAGIKTPIFSVDADANAEIPSVNLPIASAPLPKAVILPKQKALT